MYVLGIDLGTNSVKALIMELETGHVAGFGQRGSDTLGVRTSPWQDMILGKAKGISNPHNTEKATSRTQLVSG